MRGMPRKRIDPRTFKLPDDHSQLKSFIEKYDKNQQQLQTLAAVDDLLSGMLQNLLKSILMNTNILTIIMVRDNYNLQVHPG